MKKLFLLLCNFNRINFNRTLKNYTIRYKEPHYLNNVLLKRNSLFLSLSKVPHDKICCYMYSDSLASL